MNDDEEEEIKPINFLYKCASLVHLQRESVDPIIIQYIWSCNFHTKNNIFYFTLS